MDDIKQVIEAIPLIKRVVFQATVKIQSFNSSENFFASECNNFGKLLRQCCEKFHIDAERLTNPCFYYVPKDPNATLQQRLEQRVTINNNPEWQRFLDQWEAGDNTNKIINLYFVSGDLSPSIVHCPAPPSPPKFEPDESEGKSEPQSSHGLTERDGGKCMVCGYKDSVETCHIVDEKRSELLEGVPDAPDINDLRNFIQLCPNHHTSFDRYEWTLVEEKRIIEGKQVSGYWVRSTPIKEPSSDLSVHMSTFIQFNEPAPPPHSFLLKQLGRFEVPCRICNKLFSPSGIWSHYHAQHKKRKKEWKDLPHLLPHIPDCHCDGRGNNPWQLYCHVIKHHPSVLYR